MPTDISTFVFFDTETTGLPRHENNLTKITELSMVAVSKDNISKTPFGSVPEIIKKLSVLLNPQRPISSEAVKLNGLTNDFLKDFPSFGEKFETIYEFLNDLPKPVCMIAHNGDEFDYPILLAECNEVNMKLPSDLLCYDSKVAFRSILTGTTISFESLSLELESEVGNNANRETSQVDAAKQNSETQISVGRSTIEETSVSQESGSEIQSISDDKAIQNAFMKEETKSKKSNEVDRKTDSRIIVKQESSVSSTRSDVEKNTSKRQNFSWSLFGLENLYKRLTNKAPNNAHRAEADCFILLECVVALKSEFIALSESSCKLLSEIPPLGRK